MKQLNVYVVVSEFETSTSPREYNVNGTFTNEQDAIDEMNGIFTKEMEETEGYEEIIYFEDPYTRFAKRNDENWISVEIHKTTLS